MPRPLKNQLSRNSKDGFVYFYRYGPYVKIGKTHNKVDTHFRGAQTYLPPGVEFSIERVIETQDCDALELQLHARFASRRIKGEWFELTTAEVERI